MLRRLKKRGETRLFPELPYQNDNYGHKVSKWFGRFKKRCGIDSDQLVFHSLRHTLSNNLKQQLINETLIDELTGHVIQGETMGRYGKRYEIKVLFEEAVMKLDYTGVDLEHLKDSKWTG
jgi:integrase